MSKNIQSNRTHARGNNLYNLPKSLQHACEILSGGSCQIIAGGTDVFASSRLPRVPILDVSRLCELQEITVAPEEIRIGAGVTWKRIREARPLLPRVAALCEAAAAIGSRQIQAKATLGGNLCNASPAADGIPPLLAAGAALEILSCRGRRTTPLEEFLLERGRTALCADELLCTICIPTSPKDIFSNFAKVGLRRDNAISIVMASLHAEFGESRSLEQIRVAVGACSPVAQRLERLERRLIADPRLLKSVQVEDSDLSDLVPIDDIRAGATYRLWLAKILVSRLLSKAADYQTHGARNT